MFSPGFSEVVVQQNMPSVVISKFIFFHVCCHVHYGSVCLTTQILGQWCQLCCRNS